jgi:putative alpha-1,2-mannosidase
MVQLSPDNTNSYSSTSYSADAGTVWGFSHQHINSAGCPAAGEVLVTPSTTNTPITTRQAIPLLDQDNTEKASAGFYTAQLQDGTTAELTASTRVGEHRYTFPTGPTGNISFNVGQQAQ